MAGGLIIGPRHDFVPHLRHEKVGMGMSMVKVASKNGTSETFELWPKYTKYTKLQKLQQVQNMNYEKSYI